MLVTVSNIRLDEIGPNFEISPNIQKPGNVRAFFGRTPARHLTTALAERR